MLLSQVNIAYYQALTAGAGARAALAAGRFAKFHAATKAGWDRGGLPPHSNLISGGLDATPSDDAKWIHSRKTCSARCHLRGDPPWPLA